MNDHKITDESGRKGILYCVGVGPGDPELMTLKAVRIVKSAPVIAAAGRTGPDSVAWRIAVRAVPEMEKKEYLPIEVPMTRNLQERNDAHARAAERIGKYLEKGMDVAFLTLGDPAIYSSCAYVGAAAERAGFETEVVSGVTAMSACAAALKIPLAEWDEPLHVIPAVHRTDDLFLQEGNYVLMKSGKHAGELRKKLLASGRKVWAVQNCGMDGEKIYHSAEELPEEAGYFLLMIVK